MMKTSPVERYTGSTAAFFELRDIPSARIGHDPDKPPFTASGTDMGWCGRTFISMLQRLLIHSAQTARCLPESLPSKQPLPCLAPFREFARPRQGSLASSRRPHRDD